MQNFIKKHYKKIVLLILGFMLAVSVLNAKNDSAIFDETAHIGAGYSYVTQNEIRLNPEHPPLIKNLSGLPLLFLDLNFDTNQPFWTGELPRKWDEGQWAAGRSLLYESGNDPDSIIFWSRLPIILLSLLLGWFIFFWTRKLAGISAGLFALALYAFDPNILGHNHFVTTDLGIAAFFTFAFYFYLEFIKEPSWKNTALFGIFLGLLQLTKFSFLISFPIFVLIAILFALTKRSGETEKDIWKFKFKKVSEYTLKGFLAFLLSLIIVWGAYLPNTFKMSQETVTASIDFNFPPEQTENIKEVYTRKALHQLNKNSITRPLTIYIEGIGYVFRRVAGGNGAYFMQEVSSTAFPAYFPTVFIIKEPLVSLFLMILVLALIFSRGIVSLTRKLLYHLNQSAEPTQKDWSISSFIRHNITSIALFSFISLYAYISITGNLNIGFRHLFPILPFIYILTAKVLFDFLKRINFHAKKIWGLVFTILILLLVSETIAVYPAYMSYFNPIAGGPYNGFYYVTDSNADWGQDLKRLKNWVDEYNDCAENSTVCVKCCMKNNRPKFPLVFEKGRIEKIRINYFGGGNISHYFGDVAIDWWDSKRPIEPGFYAISVNYLQGSIYDKTKPDNESYRWLQGISPVTQVGTSIFIYYITPEQATAAN